MFSWALKDGEDLGGKDIPGRGDDFAKDAAMEKGKTFLE